MSFFVAVVQWVRPDGLDCVLRSIQSDFATSRRLHPGRRGTRIFLGLEDPSRFLALGEWDSQADFEQLRRTPQYQETSVHADPPARIEYLKRLRQFERMSTRPAVIASAIMTASGTQPGQLTEYVLRDAAHPIEQSLGLISHEIYRVNGPGERLLVVHGWRSLDDLQQFRTAARSTYDAVLHELGVSVESFSGALAAQFSRFDLRSDERAKA